MALGFPNRSRSYDAEHRRVRFWGHDSAIEVHFLLEQDALIKLVPSTEGAEAAILAAFDAMRDRVLDVARRVYTRRDRQNFYVLSAADF